MSDEHIIIAGDSNALGFLNTGPAPYVPTARVQIWADTNSDGIGDAWNYMNPGVNTGTPANPQDWGPEVAIANNWLAANPTGNLWIVKDAETVKGGATLAVEWNPQTGSLFASTTHAAQAAWANVHGGPWSFDHYDAAMIVLGENDAEVPAYAQAYQTNLHAFDAAVRASWNARTIIESRIEDTMGAPADNQAVRVAQWAEDQADPLMASFKTIGFEQQPDHVHYDAAGHIALGNGFFSGWVA